MEKQKKKEEGRPKAKIKVLGENEDVIQELRQKLEECEKAKKEYLSGWQRERADFLNYKKEESKRVKELIEYANNDIILKFLSILDNFDIAEKHISQELQEREEIKGLLQIRLQIKDMLKGYGLEEIECMGKKFDPNFQEAVEEVDIDEAKKKIGGEVEPGVVVEEIQKGYAIHGKVLRPAKVKVVKENKEKKHDPEKTT